MEASLKKSCHGGLVKEEKRNKANQSTSDDEEGCAEDNIDVFKVGKERKVREDDNMKSPQQKDLANDKEDDLLESAKSDMKEVMEENQRLRMHLDRIMKDYSSLQMQFHDVIQKDAQKSKTALNNEHECDQAELVSLSLGRTSSDTKKELSKILTKDNQEKEHKGGLTLGLGCKLDQSSAKTSKESSPTNLGPENSLEVKDEKAGEMWPHHGILKQKRNEENDVSQQNPAKRTKVSIRVRCDAPTMNDGCQWRKYGQKTAKGNPCPRAYYRCTVAPSCPVRKQVQRCLQDMSILIVTYEGTHNHALPVSATAMALTTSAAASMLLSGSSSSSGSGPNNPQATNTSTNINGLNFYLSDNTSKPNQFYLSNSSSQHPTITLDLTSTSSTSLIPQNNRMNNNYSNYPPRYSASTNLNISYANQVYNKNQESSLSFASWPPQENINLFQSYLQNDSLKPTQSLLPQDTIAAAAKAITSDPKFQSALAVALTSIIGSGGVEEKSGGNLKVTEPFPVLCSFPSNFKSN